MRNAAELRAAARATGTYDDYVGDGATVPWEVGVPPLGFLLYTYKQYLDAHWPEAFKLHDWCYTPYGALIGVTQEEADEALYEEIAATSIPDAVIVFGAVRLGGGPYFGQSMTGYYPLPRPGDARNIPFANFTSNLGAGKMPTKIVMLFQAVTEKGNNAVEVGYVSRQHIAGWSEHFWDVTDNLPFIIETLKSNRGGVPSVLQSRAGILCKNATLLGVRLYKKGSGRGQFVPVSYPGQYVQADIPQMALLIKGQSLDGTARLFTCRGIPDNQVVGGEFSPTPSFASAAGQYLVSLKQWYFQALTPGLPSFPIVNITAGGLVSLAGANTYAIGDYVDFGRLNLVTGKQVKVKAQVTALGPLANQFTVGNGANPWLLGPTTGGKASQKILSLHQFDYPTTRVSRVVTRRVGRPFEQYRGRRSRRP